MDTEQIVRECGWRFYAGRHLNSARFGAEGTPYSAAMVIKGFFSCDVPNLNGPREAQKLLRASISAACPALTWRTRGYNYQPHNFAYTRNGELVPFDLDTGLKVDEASDSGMTFWEFVENECRRDELQPPSFGEAIQCRFTLSDEGRILARLHFNHALVDGLMIFRFSTAFERTLEARGARVLGIELQQPGSSRKWRVGRIEYGVEDMTVESNPALAERGFDYMPILFEIVKPRWFSRIRQAIALPRKPLLQLVIAPVHKSLTFATFRRRNLATIRKARNGTRLSSMLDEYRQDPEEGDRYIRRLSSSPGIIRYLAGSVIGDLMVSSFMYKHPKCLAFPVVHPLQREGIAICNVWSDKEIRTARITWVRKLRGQR